MSVVSLCVCGVSVCLWCLCCLSKPIVYTGPGGGGGNCEYLHCDCEYLLRSQPRSLNIFVLAFFQACQIKMLPNEGGKEEIIIGPLPGDRGRSKKWKEILKLPPVSQSLCLRDEIGESEDKRRGGGGGGFGFTG